MFFLKDLPSREILERYSIRFPDMDIDKTEMALHQLRRASVLIRDLDSYFTSNGLSQTRFYILIVLDRDPELKCLSLMDFVARLDVSKPVITNTLKTLEKDGLVNISASKSDARSKNVSITEEGKSVLQKLLPGYYQTINRHVTDCGRDDGVKPTFVTKPEKLQ